jgi:hypothetical protein
MIFLNLVAVKVISDSFIISPRVASVSHDGYVDKRKEKIEKKENRKKRKKKKKLNTGVNKTLR